MVNDVHASSTSSKALNHVFLNIIEIKLQWVAIVEPLQFGKFHN